MSCATCAMAVSAALVSMPRLVTRVGVEPVHRWAGIDGLTHERVREARLVDLVVTGPAVADQIDQDAAAELGRDRAAATRAHAGDRLRIVAGLTAPAPRSAWRCRSRGGQSGPPSGVVVKPTWLLMTMWMVPPMSNGPRRGELRHLGDDGLVPAKLASVCSSRAARAWRSVRAGERLLDGARGPAR